MYFNFLPFNKRIHPNYVTLSRGQEEIKKKNKFKFFSKLTLPTRSNYKSYRMDTIQFFLPFHAHSNRRIVPLGGTETTDLER